MSLGVARVSSPTPLERRRRKTLLCTYCYNYSYIYNFHIYNSVTCLTVDLAQKKILPTPATRLDACNRASQQGVCAMLELMC